MGRRREMIGAEACNASEHSLRVQLAEQVNNLIAARNVSQTKAAIMLDTAQPHISELKNYKLDRFTSARLLRYLTLLDCDIDIVIRRKGRGRMVGAVRVSFA